MSMLFSYVVFALLAALLVSTTGWVSALLPGGGITGRDGALSKSLHDSKAWAGSASVLQHAATWPGQATEAEHEFLDWLTQQGASVGAVAFSRSAAGVRGIYATRDISKNDLLAAVPHRLMIKAPFRKYDLHGAGALLMMMLREVGREQQSLPFLAVLPTLHESAQSPDKYHLPRSYWKLLQSEVAESHIRKYRTSLAHFWKQNEQLLKPLGGSLKLLRYAVWLVNTRGFDHDGKHYAIWPLVDMANHVNGCPNDHAINMPCPANPKEPCVEFRAGEHIAAGSEVCIEYGWLRNDEAFLQYGFNMDEAHATEVLYVSDMHNATVDALAGVGRAFAKPPPFQGSAVELQREYKRLSERLKQLQVFDSEAAAWPKAKQDPDGVILQQVWQWRQLRQKAVRNELERLEHALKQELGKGKGHVVENVAASSKSMHSTEL